MEIGEDALGDGMDLVPGTAQANTLDTEINKTRDYIVQRVATLKTWVTSTIAALWPLSIARGGTGATTSGGALVNLGTWRNSGAVAAGYAPSLGWDGQGLLYEVPGFKLPTRLANLSDIPTYSGIYEGYLSPSIYGRGLSGWRSVAIQSDGVLGQTSSARRFKDNIAPLDITDEQLLQLQVVEFDWKADGSHDVGLIADDVAEIVPWGAYHDENGQVQGVHYERMFLALLPAVQRLIRRANEEESK